MPSYDPFIAALNNGDLRVWLSVDGALVDGVRLSQDLLLPDAIRISLAKSLAALPIPLPEPPPSVPDENMVATEKINIRATPDQSKPRIGEVQQGDKLTVNGVFHDPASGLDYTLIKSINGLKLTTPEYTGRKWLTPDVPAPIPAPVPVPQPPQSNIVTRWTTASAKLKQHTLPDKDSPEGGPMLPLNTPVQVDGNSITNGYLQRVDNKLWLSAQYLTAIDPATVQPQPPAVPAPTGWTPAPYPRQTLHYVAGGNWEKVAGWLKQRKDMGKPVPGLVIVSMGWSNEPLPENAIAAGALEVIWRDFPGGASWGNWDDVQGSYQAGYDHVMNMRLPDGSLEHTSIQIINEPTAVGPGTAAFWNGAFDGAIKRSAVEGRPVRLAYPMFSVGFPPLEFWDSFVDVLRRGRDEGHRFALHQYRAFWDQDGQVGTDLQAFLNTVAGDTMHRHIQIFARLPADLKHEPLALAEAFSRVATRIPLDWYTAAVKVLNAMYSIDPNIAWAAHWLYGHGGDSDWEISEIYDEKAEAIFAI